MRKTSARITRILSFIDTIDKLKKMSANIREENVQVCDNSTSVSNDEDKEILQSIEDSLQSENNENAADKTETSNSPINLIEIVNNMEADRKKFIELVRVKLFNQEKEMKVWMGDWMGFWTGNV